MKDIDWWILALIVACVLGATGVFMTMVLVALRILWKSVYGRIYQ